MFEASHNSNFVNDPTNLYEVLDIKPDASPSEIREAYVRIKNTYSKDSVALYSLVEGSEREDILRRIEKAYEVLSNPDKRRRYDCGFDTFLANEPGAAAPTELSLKSKNVISIDRFPPMESVERPENALVAPATDFSYNHPAPTAPVPASMVSPTPPPEPTPAGTESLAPSPASPAPAPDDIEVEIQAETEWSGAFLRKVRETRGIAIDDITAATRITRAYIMAIEEENLVKLPAPVYIRGFVNQISRILRLTRHDVAAAYIRRAQRLHPEKFR